jgi:hypothetical protein
MGIIEHQVFQDARLEPELAADVALGVGCVSGRV